MGEHARRVLVTGCSGMLGSELASAFARSSAVIGTDLAEPSLDALAERVSLDVTDDAAVATVLADAAPDVVVHCAALVDVDRAEADPEAVRAVNALGTRNVARNAGSAKLVYISTDSVFDGSRGGYAETDEPRPLNAYAATKLEGECFARALAADHLVLRTNFFGRASAGKPSLVRWIVESLRAGEPVRLADDWLFTTLYAADLADLVVEMVGLGASGLYHLAGGETCSKYDFGAAAAAEFGLDGSGIERVRFADLEFAAPRPRDASLDCSKAAALLGRPMPTYREGLRALRADWA